MDDWDGFYTLIGGTAGTLIGLIFVVITLGMEHAREGDTDRTQLFVTPILVYFASLLIISLAMIPPLSETMRALALGVIGCAGLGYTINLAFLLRHLAKPEETSWGRISCCRSRPIRSSCSRPRRGRSKPPSPI
jgi:hypothetical protein